MAFMFQGKSAGMRHALDFSEAWDDHCAWCIPVALVTQEKSNGRQGMPVALIRLCPCVPTCPSKVEGECKNDTPQCLRPRSKS